VNELSDQLQQTRRLLPAAAIVDVSGGIAHDINNPLQIILGKVQVDKLRNGETPLHTEIEKQAMRIANLTRGLMQLVRPLAGSGGLIDLKAELRAVLDLLARQFSKAEAEVVMDFEGKIPLFKGSNQKIRQLLLTMIVGARSRSLGKQKMTFSGGLSAEGLEIILEFTGQPFPAAAPLTGNEVLQKGACSNGDGENLNLQAACYLAEELGGRLILNNSAAEVASMTVVLPVGKTMA
ncbi:MAG TPA: hypothetical protein PLG66_21345, partial [Calditrichia bacterium]|nr:hypothetical protein [Calditrichia bacterium]